MMGTYTEAEDGIKTCRTAGPSFSLTGTHLRRRKRRISAPRWPQLVQVNFGWMSECLTSSPQPSALLSTWCDQR